MTIDSDKKSLLVFGAVILVFLVLAVLAFQATGQMGIEERFHQAVGLPMEAEEDDGGFFGFGIEGNIVAYLGVLAILLAASAIAVWHGKKQEGKS